MNPISLLLPTNYLPNVLVSLSSLLRLLKFLLVALVAAPFTGAQPAQPINQLDYSPQACGPAAILSALAFGGAQQQAAYRRIPFEAHTQQIRWVIGRYGRKPTRHLVNVGRFRWNRKTGVNVADLTDMANELAEEIGASPLKDHHLERGKHDQDGSKLLHDTFKKIERSLNKEVPPILQLRRIAHVHSRVFSRRVWSSVHGHFIVITAATLDKESQTITIRYIDPWGGKIHSGTLKIPDQKFYADNPALGQSGNFQLTPYLVADTPRTGAGLSKLEPGTPSVLTCPYLIAIP